MNKKNNKAKKAIDEKHLLLSVVKESTYKDVVFIIQSIGEKDINTANELLSSWSTYSVFGEKSMLDESVANYLFRMYLSTVSDLLQIISSNKRFTSLTNRMEYLDINEAEEYLNELENCKSSIKKVFQKFKEVIKSQDLNKGEIGYFLSTVPVSLFINHGEVNDYEPLDETVDEVLFYILKRMSIYYFYDLFHLDNYQIKGFKFQENYDFKTIYGNKKIITDSIIGEYVNKRKTLHEVEFNTFQFESDFDEKITSAINIFFEKISNYMYFKDENIKPIIIDKTSYNMPFFNFSYCVSDNNSLNVQLDSYIDLLKVFNQRESQKYAMPRDGCVLVFLREEVLLKEALIKDLGSEYLFEIKFKEGSFKYDDGKNVDKARFIFNKESLYSIFKLDKDSLDNGDFLKNDVMNYYDVCSAYLNFKEQHFYIEFATVINLLFSCCLYCALVDINQSEVNIYNTGNTCDIGVGNRNTSYKTAYIRKLPVGYHASQEAKSRAAISNVIVPNGFTFVREHIPDNDNAQKTLNIAL